MIYVLFLEFNKHLNYGYKIFCYNNFCNFYYSKL